MRAAKGWQEQGACFCSACFCAGRLCVRLQARGQVGRVEAQLQALRDGQAAATAALKAAHDTALAEEKQRSAAQLKVCACPRAHTPTLARSLAPHRRLAAAALPSPHSATAKVRRP